MMNDIQRAKIIRERVIDTKENFQLYKEAVTGVRADLQAIGTNKNGVPDRWAVRYPNGSRPANEADTVFMANARTTVLDMMEKIEALEKTVATQKEENEALAAQNLNLRDEIEFLKQDGTETVAALISEQAALVVNKGEVSEELPA